MKVRKSYLVTDQELVAAITHALDSLDGDELAIVANDLLGGICMSMGALEHNPDDTTYVFIPNEYYGGAFDPPEVNQKDECPPDMSVKDINRFINNIADTNLPVED